MELLTFYAACDTLPLVKIIGIAAKYERNILEDTFKNMFLFNYKSNLNLKKMVIFIVIFLWYEECCFDLDALCNVLVLAGAVLTKNC